MLSEKQRRAIGIALLIVGVGMTAASVILVLNTDMHSPLTLRKLAPMLATFGACMIGASWRRLGKNTKLQRKIDETIGYEEEPGYNSEENKLLRLKARSLAVEITVYLLLTVAALVVVFTEIVWIPLAIMGVCFVHFIIEKCLAALYKRGNQ